MEIDFNEKIDSELENVTFKLKKELNFKRNITNSFLRWNLY